MSLLRDHFKDSFNIGFKIGTETTTKNAHNQEVKAWTVGATEYDAYLSELKGHNPNSRVKTSDALYMDIATHKIYTDIAENAIKVGDKIILTGNRYGFNEYLVQHITPQRDEAQKGIDHLIIYVKSIRNDN